MNAKVMNKESKKPGVVLTYVQGDETISCLIEEPTSTQADKTEDESTSDEVNHNTVNIIQKLKRPKNQTVRDQFLSPIERQSCRKKRFLRKGSTRKKRSKVFSLIFLTFSQFGTLYAEDPPIATIETSPIVFGEDVTFLCLYTDRNMIPSLSTKWLKGLGKDSIIYGNASTKGEKYTSVIYHEKNIYQYLLTIHNISVSDLDSYSCEFDFKAASLMFTMDGNLPFIYLPNSSDMVVRLSEFELNIWIQMIYPQPKNCTAVYNDEDISDLMTQKDKREKTMFSTQIQLNLTEYSGYINISCIIGSRSFIWSRNIHRNCKEIECYTEKEANDKHIIFIVATIVAVLTLAAVISIVFILFFINKTRPRDQDQNYTELNLS